MRMDDCINNAQYKLTIASNLIEHIDQLSNGHSDPILTVLKMLIDDALCSVDKMEE